MTKKYLYKGKLITASTKKEAITKIKASTNDKYIDLVSKVFYYTKVSNVNLGEKEFYLMSPKTLPIYIGGLNLGQVKAKLKNNELNRLTSVVINSKNLNKKFISSLTKLGFVNHLGSFIYDFEKVVTSSAWSKKELEELGMTEKELTEFSKKHSKETFEIA